MEVKLINPTKTLPISVTGNKCQLKCKHCNAKYLNHMVNIKDLEKVDLAKYTSFLVSGGSTRYGNVPFTVEDLDILSKYPQKKNFHTGLMEDEYLVKNIAAIADAISLDVVADDTTIHYVYNLNKRYKNYKKTLELFLKYSPNVFPHITIGLNGGKLSHEFKSIDLVSEYKEIKGVVFLVLIPTKNTFFENTPYTALDDIKSVLEYAKIKLKTNIILGCMKPHGQYGEKIDLLAKDYVNGIVKPTKMLGKPGNNECCVLSYI